jgi:hypothetical protein
MSGHTHAMGSEHARSAKPSLAQFAQRFTRRDRGACQRTTSDVTIGRPPPAADMSRHPTRTDQMLGPSGTGLLKDRSISTVGRFHSQSGIRPLHRRFSQWSWHSTLWRRQDRAVHHATQPLVQGVEHCSPRAPAGLLVIGCTTHTVAATRRRQMNSPVSPSSLASAFTTLRYA